MIIKSAEFVISNTDIAKCPQDNLPEYAFIGRSNVGKSSLINMLVNHKRLALTSSTPGKTMLINHFLINKEWYLVDLPGYGYAKRGHEARKQLQTMIDGYVLERTQLTNLFLLIDCRLRPLPVDLEFSNRLGEYGIPFSIVFTKADKLSHAKLQEHVRTYLDILRERWEEVPPHFVSSAATQAGRDEILHYIDTINNRLKQN